MALHKNLLLESLIFMLAFQWKISQFLYRYFKNKSKLLEYCQDITSNLTMEYVLQTKIDWLILKLLNVIAGFY